MATICDSCEDRIRLAHQDAVIERIRDAAQAAIMADLRREYPRGWKSALEWAIRQFDGKEETK